MSRRSYGKRSRPEPESDDDLDEDEKEALRAFNEEGFNEDMVKTEEERKKKVYGYPLIIRTHLLFQVEQELDRKQKETEVEKKR